MIPAKPLDRAISNTNYRLGKYYVWPGLIYYENQISAEIISALSIHIVLSKF